MNEREFLEQYVLNAALGAGSHKLNVAGAVKEAREAWRIIEEAAPRRPPQGIGVYPLAKV